MWTSSQPKGVFRWNTFGSLKVYQVSFYPDNPEYVFSLNAPKWMTLVQDHEPLSDPSIKVVLIQFQSEWAPVRSEFFRVWLGSVLGAEQLNQKRKVQDSIWTKLSRPCLDQQTLSV